MSDGHFFMTNNVLYEAKNMSSIYSKKKRDENIPNLSEMEDTELQDGFDSGAVFSASTLHQYANI